MRCDNCSRDATQINETYQLCSRCYTVKYSTMNIDGETMSLPEAFKLQREKSGLARKEGESMTDWSGRCRAWAGKQGSYGASAVKIFGGKA